MLRSRAAGLRGRAAVSGARRQRMGQIAATPFVGAYDAIPNLVHVYEPARCTLSAYTGGALLRLRRDSDDAEADFSHVSATDPELNVASITAWLAGSDGYIVSVYDQKTGDTITQAAQAAQPLFVANIKNGHAGGRFNGTSHYWRGTFTLGGALSQPFTLYSGAKLDAVAVNDGVTRYLTDSDDNTNRMITGTYTIPNPDDWRIFAGVTLAGSDTDSNWNLWACLFNGAASRFWINDVVQTIAADAGAHNADGITVGAHNSGSPCWDGDWVLNVIADPSHSDAQRAAMQTAINAYWGIY